MPPAPPPGSFGSSGAKAACAPSASAAAFAEAPASAAAFAAAAAFHGGGGLRGGCLRGGNLGHLGGSVRAGRQDFRAVDRAGLQHAEPLVCEPALAQGFPGFGFLSKRHGEGAAQGLEFSSQANARTPTHSPPGVKTGMGTPRSL